MKRKGGDKSTAKERLARRRGVRELDSRAGRHRQLRDTNEIERCWCDRSATETHLHGYDCGYVGNADPTATIPGIIFEPQYSG
ncbi:unnamed protein product [Caenorhabditis auriculariae]|uniref:Uncharacterized protein n=1 Tax=Caenorhabditis auriculariae TaxID=2777116 RepID=A0A8S1GPG7_9PELO|nr:unnamed protein product [Caenorhabditis auriculariae]